MQIATAITTAPRTENYIDGLLKALPISLMNCTVIAEPGSHPTPKDKTITHDKKKGCLHNWDFALRYLLSASNAPFVCVLQDDIEFTSSYLVNKLEPLKYIGFYSFYTPVFYKPKLKKDGWQHYNNGWNSVGACALLFPRKSAEQLIEHPMYTDHLLNYSKNEQVDAIVCTTFKEIGIPTMYHKPSICRHIGDVSSIGHQDMKHITNPL